MVERVGLGFCRRVRDGLGQKEMENVGKYKKIERKRKEKRILGRGREGGEVAAGGEMRRGQDERV